MNAVRTERAIPVMSISTLSLGVLFCFKVWNGTVGGSIATALRPLPIRRLVVDEQLGAWNAAAEEAEAKSVTATESFIVLFVKKTENK